MEWYEILILIASILLVIYLSGFVYVLHQLRLFSRKLKRETMTANAVLSEKRDVLLSMWKICDGKKLIVETSKNSLATQTHWVKFEKLDAKALGEANARLDETKRFLFVIGERTPKELLGEEYFSLKELLDDLDRSYRHLISVYATDMTGYEYWRKLLVYRPVMFILGFRAKVALS